MAKDRHNVIMFPSWQENLEEKSVQLVNEKKFSEALKTIDKLISHNASTFNTNMLKLLCHVELDEYDEAMYFCESILTAEESVDYDYYAYLEFYLTILYQTNNFEELITVYEEEERERTIPEYFKKRFEELYKLSYQMNEQKKHSDSLQYLKELEKMINEKNVRGQWEFINGLRKIGLTPPNEVIQLLSLHSIHPVTKTTIFNWLKETNFSEIVEVEKFGETVNVIPNEVEKLGKHPIIKKTMFYLVDIEQDNPSLYEMIEDLLIRYTYVKYPIFYCEDDASSVAEALIYIGKKNLYLPVYSEKISKKVNDYIKDINHCNELYLNVIES